MSKMLEILSGDIYQIKARKQALIDQFLSQNEILGVENIDLETRPDITLSEFLTSISTLSLFNSPKLIFINHLSSRAEFKDNIEHILQVKADDIHLVIIESKLDLKTNFGKLLKRHPSHKEYKVLTGYQLQNWLCQQAANYSTKITPPVADYLIGKVGEDSISLDTELRKLQIYPEITKDLIDDLVIESTTSQIFQLLRELFSGDLNKVLELYNDQLIQKNHPLNILGSIVWQLQQVVIIKSQSQPIPITAKAFKMHEFVAQKSQVLAKSISWRQLNKLIDLCHLTDKHIKVDFMDPERAVEYLMTRGCYIIQSIV
ncbi:MAG: DNA polymerase III subunit delta [Candidatus Saccharibacteria bacterium]|nr:DNA polymerase III subunit delta [Candidatus Saccharibacteria bacterium]